MNNKLAKRTVTLFHNHGRPLKGSGRKPHNNDLCGCGSGKKFKKCCKDDTKIQ